MRAPVLPVLLLAIACQKPAVTERPLPADPHATLHDLNREAREAGATVDTIHGVEVADPYRALETDDALTRRWVAAQNLRTEEALPVDPVIRERLGQLFAIGSLSRVSVAAERVFFQRRAGDAEQPQTFVRVGDDEHLLLDPTRFGPRAALDWAFPSPDGTKLAFGVSQNGDERSVLHVLDVDAVIAAGEDADLERAISPLRIPRTKWCNLAWLPDGSGFYYTRYPAPGEDKFDEANEDTYFPRVFLHALGGDPAEDRLVFGAEAGTDFPIPTVSRDGRWLVVNVFRGWSASDVHLLDRHADTSDDAPDDERRRFTTVIAGEEAVTSAVPDGEHIFLLTNLGAPRYRVARVPLSDAGRRDAWEDVVPEGPAPIEHWALVGDVIALHVIDEIRSKLLVAPRAPGGEPREVVLPSRGALAGLSGSPGERTLAFVHEGYLQPPTLFAVDASRLGAGTGAVTNAARVLSETAADFDFSAYEERLVRVRSADGTEVPVTVLHRRGLEGPARALLYGYGGFNVSLLPTLSRNALAWIERGGVYAVANLRGGAELGEAWHRAGMRENKQRVFEDFEAVIGWLSESGLSSPDRIGITGGSNGGLLMGAMVTRVPERFGAAASYVGLYDMVRYHRFPPAELWISEYGNADEDRAQLDWLLAYSPYHRVRAGAAYPAVLLETADHDSRVHWAHTTKLAAALQEATTSNRPIYFWMERQVGHGAGTRTSDAVEKYARMFSFFDQQLR
ncbi:MAG: S9 family peptidase [Myxococcales bacterium]|nr:S9 family peptidase [Myxococcales bacterium]